MDSHNKKDEVMPGTLYIAGGKWSFILGGSAALLLTTRVLTRTQLVLLQDNDNHDNFGNRAQTKFINVHNLQVAEGCSFLTICVLARILHKITARAIMLTILAAEFGSCQRGQRWSKLARSWAFGNHTGSEH
ncbi:hypothetical protein K443DRAFT_223491 [Laccaria amethystina LaAM-08-1]|uniref:Uncharacterized protein n=1 Tax=Laccaria amethystina LaAM-08-1 TaxID=1095629 RepID=A0A0C9X9I4_9AGAR|nr:hypothetical protein K443DRAFT_223491 [Laccaria amethystina LaAM-08-1]